MRIGVRDTQAVGKGRARGDVVDAARVRDVFVAEGHLRGVLAAESLAGHAVLLEPFRAVAVLEIDLSLGVHDHRDVVVERGIRVAPAVVVARDASRRIAARGGAADGDQIAQGVVAVADDAPEGILDGAQAPFGIVQNVFPILRILDLAQHPLLAECVIDEAHLVAVAIGDRRKETADVEALLGPIGIGEFIAVLGLREFGQDLIGCRETAIGVGLERIDLPALVLEQYVPVFALAGDQALIVVVRPVVAHDRVPLPLVAVDTLEHEVDADRRCREVGLLDAKLAAVHEDRIRARICVGRFVRGEIRCH